jgi:hypothetical protein
MSILGAEMRLSSLNEYGVQLSTLVLERMSFELEYLSSTLTVFDPQIRSRLFDSFIQLVFASREFFIALSTFAFYVSLIFTKFMTLALPFVSLIPNYSVFILF